MFFTVLTALAFLPEPLFTYIVARFYIFGKHIFDFCIYFFCTSYTFSVLKSYILKV